ncbi:MAG TPA: hypothetical protein VGD98_06360 [Ktedonobacteraceae bacterium]
MDHSLHALSPGTGSASLPASMTLAFQRLVNFAALRALGASPLQIVIPTVLWIALRRLIVLCFLALVMMVRIV